MLFLASLALFFSGQLQVQRPNYDSMLASVVRVEVAVANMLDLSERQSGHGTGFIVELTPKKGIIFTNAHVVEVPSRFYAAQTRVVFNVSEAAGTNQSSETIEAKVVYRSPLHDFAVIEFDPRRLKRARNWIRPIPGMASLDESKELAAVMRPVLAIGNPLESRNSFTDGRVSTIFVDPAKGYFIQTNAAINPGNSGGPLFDAVTGKVIGINTMKLVAEGVDNVGWALPIWLAAKDYESFRTRPSHQKLRGMAVTYRVLEEDEVVRIGRKDEILRKFPNFFETYDGVTMVDNFSAPFEVGDIMLAIDGQTFGGRVFDLIRICHQYPGTKIPVTVLRRGKIVNLSAPIYEIHQHEGSSGVKFLMASGILFAPHWTLEEQLTPEAKDGVRIVKVLNNGIAANLGMDPSLAILKGLEIEGKKYPVRSLENLRAILRRFPPKTLIRYHFNSAVRIQTNTGVQVLRDEDGFIIMDPKLRIATMPLGEVISHHELDLSKFRDQFDHSFRDPSKNDWRRFLSRCERSLRRLGKK